MVVLFLFTVPLYVRKMTFFLSLLLPLKVHPPFTSWVRYFVNCFTCHLLKDDDKLRYLFVVIIFKLI